MSEIEKMKRYIERTGMNNKRYDMCKNERLLLTQMTKEAPIYDIILAFVYGQAKGYRAAKAEVRRT